MSALPAPSEAMLALARSRAPADRERLMLAMADLCRATPETPGETVERLLDDIFLRLVETAERDIRARLAERLAEAAWAPRALMQLLARQDIEIARPVIRKSPVLSDHDLIRVVVEATVEHQIEVARRPNLSDPVVTALVDAEQPDALAALADNATAEVSAGNLRRLVAASKLSAVVRAPLVRHAGLTPDLAALLYGWVGEALQAELAERFQITPEALQAPLDDAVRQALASGPSRLPDLMAGQGPDPHEAERRLALKLQAAGQLRPGYLLRALREGKLSLFETALALLGGFDAATLRAALRTEDPEVLALACRAVGIDRSVFPTILELVQGLNDGQPRGGARYATALRAALELPDPTEAALRLRERLQGV